MWAIEEWRPMHDRQAIWLWCTSSRSSANGSFTVWKSGLADTLVGGTRHGEPEMRSFTVGSISDIKDALAYFTRLIRSHEAWELREG